MTIRKRNDSEGWKRGVGAYSQGVTLREGRFPDSNPGTSKRGVGAYTEDESGLRNVPANDDPQQGKFTLARGAKDIFDAVENQSSDSGNRAVKSGNKD